MAHHRIVIVGAGPGGICMAVKLLQAGMRDFVILEREGMPGGTWVNNRYPGLACDVPSAVYSFGFEPKPDWTRSYAQRAEIQAYLQHCVDKYGVGPHIRFHRRVDQARWDDEAHQWQIRTDDGSVHTADIFISALGMFNQPQWPRIEGLFDFAGDVLHTALWPEGRSFAGQRVGVVGSAASAVQLIPEVAQSAAHLTVFQRTANWIMPKKDATYSEAQLDEFRRDPALSRNMRRDQLALLEARIAYDNPVAIEEMRQLATKNLDAILDPSTREKMRPQVPLGSQRPLYSNEFYPTFNRDNVALVTEAIQRVTPEGVLTRDGQLHALDALILATGYAANKFLSVLDVRGRAGLTIQDAWQDGPQAYLGMTTTGFPNLFMLYGPNTNNGSIMTMLEHQANYVVHRLQDMAAQSLGWIDVRREVMDAYNEQLQKAIQSVEPWRALGSRYYRAESGRIVTQWPHNMAAYEALTTQANLDDFQTHPLRTVAA